MPISFRRACCNIPACRRLVGREFCEPRFRSFDRFGDSRRAERERRRRGIQPF